MTQHETPPDRRPSSLLWAIAIGLLFAAVCGVGVQASGGAAVNESRSVTTVRLTYAPDVGLIGALVGVPLGCLIAALWGRGRIAHGVAFALVMLVGGLAGLMIAAVLGTETKTTVSGNAVQVDHEASAALMAGGAVSVLILSGLAAWASVRLSKSCCAWAVSVLPIVFAALGMVLLL